MITILGSTWAPVARAADAPKAADLLLRVRVTRVVISSLPRSRENHVVKTKVLRVLRGHFAGKSFDFRVRGPRASIRAGSVVFVSARKVGSGYHVSNLAIGPLRCGVKRKICHAPGCHLYLCKGCTATQRTVAAARAAGYRLHASCTTDVTPAAPPVAPTRPRIPRSADRDCTRDRDCVIAWRPCGHREPICEDTWKAAVNRAADLKKRQRWANRKPACRRTVLCKEPGGKWLGKQAVCVKGQCTVR